MIIDCYNRLIDGLVGTEFIIGVLTGYSVGNIQGSTHIIDVS